MCNGPYPVEPPLCVKENSPLKDHGRDFLLEPVFFFSHMISNTLAEKQKALIELEPNSKSSSTHYKTHKSKHIHNVFYSDYTLNLAPKIIAIRCVMIYLGLW